MKIRPKIFTAFAAFILSLSSNLTVSAGWWDTGFPGGYPRSGVDSVAISGSGVLTAGGLGQPQISEWDSGLWNAIGDTRFFHSGGADGYISAIARYGEFIHVAGDFDYISYNGFTTFAENVARFLDARGGRWYPLGANGTGLSAGRIETIAIAQGNGRHWVYFGGDIGQANGQSVNNIVRWDSSTAQWDRLPDTFQGGTYGIPVPPWGTTGPRVRDIEVRVLWDGNRYYHEVYVGGNFEKDVQGGTAYNLAMWYDGGDVYDPHWNAFGDGIQLWARSQYCEDVYFPEKDTVYVAGLALFDSKLYIGGYFNWVDGTFYYREPDPFCGWPHLEPINLAVLDLNSSVLTPWAQSWFGDFSGPVEAVDAGGGYIYVGGRFSTISGLQVQNLARFNTYAAGWENFTSTGLDDTVFDIAVGSSSAFFGGNFTGWVARWVLP